MHQRFGQSRSESSPYVAYAQVGGTHGASFAQFVLSIDLTVLNVALPSMTAELQPTSDEQLWIVDAYSLVLAGLQFQHALFLIVWEERKCSLGGALVFCIGSAPSFCGRVRRGKLLLFVLSWAWAQQ